MSNRLIHPVILCGGSGTRLWPVSRQAYPKQFSQLMGNESLFQATVRRLSGEAFTRPVIVTASEFRFIVCDQLAAIGIEPAAILIEPEARNTAPAVLAAVLWLEKNAPGELLLVAPSDHLMAAPDTFRNAVAGAASRAEEGAIVTFGISPDRVETGYGYLELADDLDQFTPAKPLSLRRFIEKPTSQQAEMMISTGRYLWNAGILLFRSDAMASAYKQLLPQLIEPVTCALEGSMQDLCFLKLADEPWSHAPSISIDYAILEKSADLWVMPYDGSWSDLGGWEAIWGESPQDRNGVATNGSVTALGCRKSLLRSEDEGIALVAIGLEDIVAIAMPDAVLIAKRTEGQRVKEAVAVLKERHAKQATSFQRDHRPWGRFESLAMGKRFQVKRIVVQPGASLSLQSHHHRAEHWIVVEGTARVTIGDKVQLVSENQSVYIPLGEKHRLENPGRFPVMLIEVQTGAYLQEDDIIRYEDVYARK